MTGLGHIKRLGFGCIQKTCSQAVGKLNTSKNLVHNHPSSNRQGQNLKSQAPFLFSNCISRPICFEGAIFASGLSREPHVIFLRWGVCRIALFRKAGRKKCPHARGPSINVRWARPDTTGANQINHKYTRREITYNNNTN